MAKIGFGPNWPGQNHDGQKWIGQNWIGQNWSNQDGQNGIGQSRSLPSRRGPTVSPKPPPGAGTGYVRFDEAPSGCGAPLPIGPVVDSVADQLRVLELLSSFMDLEALRSRLVPLPTPTTTTTTPNPEQVGPRPLSQARFWGLLGVGHNNTTTQQHNKTTTQNNNNNNNNTTPPKH